MPFARLLDFKKVGPLLYQIGMHFWQPELRVRPAISDFTGLIMLSQILKRYE
jgi:hypothetical protein